MHSTLPGTSARNFHSSRRETRKRRLFKSKVPCWRKLWNFLWLSCGSGLTSLHLLLHCGCKSANANADVGWVGFLYVDEDTLSIVLSDVTKLGIKVHESCGIKISPECLAGATWLVLSGMTKHLAFQSTLHGNKWRSQGTRRSVHPVTVGFMPSGLPPRPFSFPWASCNDPDLSAQNKTVLECSANCFQARFRGAPPSRSSAFFACSQQLQSLSNRTFCSSRGGRWGGWWSSRHLARLALTVQDRPATSARMWTPSGTSWQRCCCLLALCSCCRDGTRRPAFYSSWCLSSSSSVSTCTICTLSLLASTSRCPLWAWTRSWRSSRLRRRSCWRSAACCSLSARSWCSGWVLNVLNFWDSVITNDC